MTRQEVKKLYDRVCDVYPNFKPHNPQFIFDLWCEYLKDETYTEVEIRLDEHIRYSEFAPSISQLLCKAKNCNFSNERNYTTADFDAMEKEALKLGWGGNDE